MAHQGSYGSDSHLRFPFLHFEGYRKKGLACGVGILHGSPSYAGVAELADALDLGSSVSRRGGSSPSTRIYLKYVQARK